ncbi:hypothetical protein CHS0354_017507 [Potamilus streckersoni]|uniref:Uncharacterized protein n=1 Tax=Potamilus streckersoni TaxID=2493646 RepID=A0AAE0S301_9BIVA|nr:hypothetical protein CHS0354_017507 [Potamilus streckersoni]
MSKRTKHQLDIENAGYECAVPNHPKARLMYYLNCMCSLLELQDADPEVNRLMVYHKYASLTEEDTNTLIELCYMFSPYVLKDRCIFQNDRLTRGAPNRFLKVSEAPSYLKVKKSVNIGSGHDRRLVRNIMVYQEGWIKENWSVPLDTLLGKRRRIIEGEHKTKVKELQRMLSLDNPGNTPPLDLEKLTKENKANSCVIL